MIVCSGYVLENVFSSYLERFRKLNNFWIYLVNISFWVFLVCEWKIYRYDIVVEVLE